MADTPGKPGQPARRRFAPVPIETTFERVRKGGVASQPRLSSAPVGHAAPPPPPPGPAGEPTPSPSPESASPPVPALWSQPPPKMAPSVVAAAAFRQADDSREPKRRFAPQLIESTRRSRRAGDVGPATKPTDKTDITPHHHHIYAPKPRKKHRKVQSLARRESCDDETAPRVFEMLAREAEKRLLEDAALAAFPNSRARAGGAEHFAIRESSEDDDSTGSHSRGPTLAAAAASAGAGAGAGVHYRLRTAGRRSRRDSLTEDVGWALREMQEHHEQLAKVRAGAAASPLVAPGVDPAGTTTDAAPRAVPPRPAQLDRISTLDLDRMSMESPPSDPIWTTTARQLTQDSAIHTIGENYMPFIPEDILSLPGTSDGYRGIPSYARQLREAEDEIDEEDEEDLLRQSAAAATAAVASDSNSNSSSSSSSGGGGLGTQVPAETAFRGRNAFAGFRNRELFASERDVIRLRKKSPPMLGKELVFPKCLSPKQTKLEPEFLWNRDGADENGPASRYGSTTEANAGGEETSHQGSSQQQPQQSQQQQRSQQQSQQQPGLWQGLCYSRDMKESMVPVERPVLLATPFPPSTPGGSHGGGPADAGPSEPVTIYAEPARMDARGSSRAASPSPSELGTGLWGGTGLSSPPPLGTPAATSKVAPPPAEARGLRMLAGLDERLRQENAAAEREEKIRTEFTDRFVTQVYNYLSLGYPAMARPYDDELSKISRISVEDLARDDGDCGTTQSAKGHISLDDDDERALKGGAGGAAPKASSSSSSSSSSCYNHDSCPRWRALKLYIYEWARQHPDLNSVNPLAWGVRERRGSWGV